MNDDELRALAKADRSEAAQRLDVAADLRTVQERVAAGETGGDIAPTRRTGWRSPWILGVAAASVIGLVAVGALVTGPDEGTIRTTPSPTDSVVPQPSAVPTVEPVVEPTVPSSEPAATATTSSTPPSTTELAAPAQSTPQTIAVDAANPPTMVTPVPIASISLNSNPDGNPISVAIGENVIAVTQPNGSTVTLVDFGARGGASATTRQVETAEPLHSIVIGPGDVLYGFGESRLPPPPSAVPIFRYVAVALSGPRQGEVLAESELSATQYAELPAGAFGHGTDGVIDRERDLNATVIEYVDAAGAPTTWDGPPPILLDSRQFDGADRIVRVVDSGLGWKLAIGQSPEAIGTFDGPSSPAPTSGGRVVYADNIGPAVNPGADFSVNTMPVVAVLEPDGSGRWVRLPDDWSVVASDVWGTVLMRTIGDSIELALLDDVVAN